MRSAPSRRRFCLGVAVVLVAPRVLADDAGAASPRAVVTAVIDAVRAALADATLNEARRRVAVDRALLRYVDFAAMAKQALGKHWGQASPEQRATLVTLLRARALAAWWGYVKDGAGADVTVDETTQGSDQRVKITTHIAHGKRRVALDWKLYLRDDRWLIYDFEIGHDGWLRRERTDLNVQAKALGVAGLIRWLQAQNAHPDRAPGNG